MVSYCVAVKLCRIDIRAWVPDNFLKLNDDRTELVLIGNLKRVAKTRNFQLQVGANTANRPCNQRTEKNVNVNLPYNFNAGGGALKVSKALMHSLLPQLLLTVAHPHVFIRLLFFVAPGIWQWRKDWVRLPWRLVGHVVASSELAEFEFSHCGTVAIATKIHKPDVDRL